MALAGLPRIVVGVFLLLLTCCISIVFSLASGSIDISLLEMFSILLGLEDSHNARVVLELRVPRVVSGFSPRWLS